MQLPKGLPPQKPGPQVCPAQPSAKPERKQDPSFPRASLRPRQPAALPAAVGCVMAVFNPWPHRMIELPVLSPEGGGGGAGLPISCQTSHSLLPRNLESPSVIQAWAQPLGREQKYPLDFWGAGSFPSFGGGGAPPLGRRRRQVEQLGSQYCSVGEPHSAPDCQPSHW